MADVEFPPEDANILDQNINSIDTTIQSLNDAIESGNNDQINALTSQLQDLNNTTVKTISDGLNLGVSVDEYNGAVDEQFVKSDPFDTDGSNLNANQKNMMTRLKEFFTGSKGVKIAEDTVQKAVTDAGIDTTKPLTKDDVQKLEITIKSEPAGGKIWDVIKVLIKVGAVIGVITGIVFLAVKILCAKATEDSGCFAVSSDGSIEKVNCDITGMCNTGTLNCGYSPTQKRGATQVCASCVASAYPDGSKTSQVSCKDLSFEVNNVINNIANIPADVSDWVSWLKKNWWWVLLIVVGFIIFIMLLLTFGSAFIHYIVGKITGEK